VIINKKRPTAASATTEKDVNAARRAGAAVEAVKKFDAGANKKDTLGQRAAKLDRETEETHHDRVSTELKKQIQNARLEKKLTQAQLGQVRPRMLVVCGTLVSPSALP
jgi:putative transcription factor